MAYIYIDYTWLIYILINKTLRHILPGLWRKITGLLLSGPKSSFQDESQFCISFGNQGPRVWRKSGEAQNPCCLKSSVKFPQSVMIWAAMSSAGVGPLCFLKSTVNAAIYQEILEHFMLPSVICDMCRVPAILAATFTNVYKTSGNPVCL